MDTFDCFFFLRARAKYTISYSHGHDHVEKGPALVAKTLGQALDETTEKYPDNNFLSFTQDGIRTTFHQFQKDVSDELTLYDYECISPFYIRLSTVSLLFDLSSSSASLNHALHCTTE